VADNKWTTDEHGTCRFRSGAVELVVWTHSDGEPDIYFDDGDLCVDIDADGLTAKGEHNHGGYIGFEALPVAIPWEILVELVHWHAHGWREG
jgi:hypothetical protein